MKIIMLSRQKVVAIAQERCFHGGSNDRALTGKNLVFWIDGSLWEVVTPITNIELCWKVLYFKIKSLVLCFIFHHNKDDHFNYG